MKVAKTVSSQLRGSVPYLGILLVVCFQVLPAVSAQDSASIGGIVKDATGAGIEAATVHIKNLETGVERSVQTDEAGRFHAHSLPVGNYEIVADKPGFRPERRSAVAVVVGYQEVDFALQVGEVHQTVEVSADSDALSAVTEDTSGLVGERQVKDLPLNGRSYDQLLTLNPGTVNYTSQRAGSTGTSNSELGNMFSVSGHRPQENLFLLNGVEYTGASEISNTPGGVSGQLLGVDAVREFAVVKDTYGAEYGKRPGAQVSIVTAG